MLINPRRSLQLAPYGRVISIAVIVMLLCGPLSVAQAKYASIVIDAESGRVLHEANADTLNYPASLTKMMTLYMIFAALQNRRITLDTRWVVSRTAARQPPSKLGLRPGQTITVRNCILALATKSANDIAVVAAEGLAGSESRFARKMTATARKLHMRQTTYRNASGLPNRGQKTTARDISRLALALMRDFPEYYRYFSTRYFQYGRRVYRNHNKLLESYRGTDGIKTGYIRASGYNLAASTVRRGRRLVGVVMGGRSSRARNQHMMTLLDRGFKQVERKPIRIAKTKNRIKDTISVASIKKPVRPAASRTGISKVAYSELPGLPQQQNWGIQVGAFTFFKPAESAASRAKIAAPRLLKAARMVVSPFRTEKRLFYRARLLGIEEHQARKACEQLIARSISCITVPPSHQHVSLTKH